MSEQENKQHGEAAEEQVEAAAQAGAESEPEVKAEAELMPEEGAEPAEQDEQSLEDRYLALEAELAQVKKRLAEADLRAQAEIQNIRRRTERDVQNAHKFALEKFAADLLGVADSLERGLDTVPADDEALQPAREGMALTLKVLLDTFARYKLEQIAPVGEPFNPELHEAMTMVPSADLEPNSVMDVLEKGYMLNGRLIRPARVIVSKAP